MGNRRRPLLRRQRAGPGHAALLAFATLLSLFPGGSLRSGHCRSALVAVADARVDEPSASGSQRRHRLFLRSLHEHYGRRGRGTRGDHSKSNANFTTAAEAEAAEAAKAAAAERAFRTYLHATLRPGFGRGANDDRAASLHASMPPFPPSRRQSNLRLIRSMFQHGWDSYLQHAYPDELQPLSCTGREFDLVKLPGLTLIDGLDMLLLLGNHTEFTISLERVRSLYASRGFALDRNVSVFETNIRVLGGLLSAHQLAVAFLHRNRVPLDRVFVDRSPDPSDDPAAAATTSNEDDAYRIREGAPGATSGSTTTVSRWSTSHSFYQDVVVSALLRDLQDHSPPPSAHPPLPSDVAAPRDAATPPILLDVCFRYDTRRNQTAATASSQSSSHRRYYQYDGFLLDLARDLGERLLPAFDTPTGIPYGTVNLLYGVPADETPIASLAGGGTLSLEFHLLSQLTGDPKFAQAAKLATRALFLRQSALGLFGKHIDVRNGQWTESLSGIGSNSDSFLEYLAKHYFLFPHDSDFWTMLVSAYTAVFHYSREGEWYVDVEMNHGSRRGHSRRVFESLMAFYPGLQVLLGEAVPAARSTNAFFLVREWLGFLPERFSYPTWKVDAGRGAGKHPLRPELLESAYFLHRATRGLASSSSSSSPHGNSTGWLWAQDFALHQLERVAKVKCGYAGVSHLDSDGSGQVYGDGDTKQNANVHLMDEMPSFFLSETLKYLYLSFDEDNVLHQDDSREWIFTTEAHPIHFVATEQAGPGKPVNESSAPFGKEREMLKELLRNRLSHKGRTKPDGADQSLKSDAWSEKTSYKSYASKIHGVDKELQARHAELHSRSLLAPFVPPSLSPTDFKNDTRQGSNFAHLALTNLGLGPGTMFRKACPNLYSSDLLWIHVLNGGALDYSEIYVSVTRDTLEDHPIDFMVLGAAEALGVHGTGVYPGANRDIKGSCPVPDSGTERTDDHEAGDNPENRQHIANPGNVVQIQSADFGVFEVMPEADGSGFYIHLVKTGETIMVTFFEEFAMTYSSAPVAGAVPFSEDATPSKTQSPWRRMGSRLSSIFGGSGSGDRHSYEDAQFSNVPMTRRVLVSDFYGNTFSCEVEVFETYTEDNHSVDEEAERSLPLSVEEMLATFPCAPARFGLTDIELLAKSGGVSIQAPAVPPPEGDEVGCRGLVHASSHITLSAADEDSSIRIVRRGECSFYTKSVNQRLRHNANGVIVVNDHDSDIFIMTASEQDEGVLVEPEVVPATVLLTGLDGDELLDKLTVDQDDEAAQVGVRISITRQPNTLDGRGADFEWPFAVGSEGALTVFAESGWGIQATKRIGRSDWQLQLLKREPVTSTSETNEQS